MIGQYPTPPPVATGPGLDRPIFVPGADYGMETYTMNRTRMFYQDQVHFLATLISFDISILQH